MTCDHCEKRLERVQNDNERAIITPHWDDSFLLVVRNGGNPMWDPVWEQAEIQITHCPWCGSELEG